MNDGLYPISGLRSVFSTKRKKSLVNVYGVLAKINAKAVYLVNAFGRVCRCCNLLFQIGASLDV